MTRWCDMTRYFFSNLNVLFLAEHQRQRDGAVTMVTQRQSHSYMQFEHFHHEVKPITIFKRIMNGGDQNFNL